MAKVDAPALQELTSARDEVAHGLRRRFRAPIRLGRQALAYFRFDLRADLRASRASAFLRSPSFLACIMASTIV